MNRYSFETPIKDRISFLNSTECMGPESLDKDLELWVNLFPDLSQLYSDTAANGSCSFANSSNTNINPTSSANLPNTMANTVTRNVATNVTHSKEKLSLEDKKKRNSEYSARHRAKKKEKESQLKADLDSCIIEINRLKNENLELSREVNYLKRLILQIHKEI